MFLLFEDGVFDFDLDLLVELLGVVDHQIARIEDEISRSPEPDGLGHFDRMEAVVGLGFVACQQYINATYPQLVSCRLVKNRLDAIQAPPKHSSGKSVTEVINATANFWKHHDEWPGPNRKDSLHAPGKQINPRRAGKRQLSPEEQTRAVIDSLVPSSSDYVMGNVLYELLHPQPPRFVSVVHLLTQWRDLLIVASA